MAAPETSYGMAGSNSFMPRSLTQASKTANFDAGCGFEEMRVYNMAWSFDGQSCAYTSGATVREVTLIEGF